MVSVGFSQVTVTNPANTTPNLAATYTSLANAVTALGGITAISGPVIITLDAGNPQTAPAGGYVIQFTAATTAANNITIAGSNNVITAFTPQTTGNINDAIFKLIGADYITIRDFTIQENAANTVNTPAASNNMTEWGVALLRATTTDGAQNNIIQNNTISLNRNYRNSFGIYSNARHASTTPTTASNATAVGGSNLGNKVYGNTISNVMMGITFIGTATAAFQDSGNDIGGSSATTGNTITNWGGNAQLSSFASNTNQSYCIFMNHQVADNISYNVLNNGTAVGTGVISNFLGIYKHYTDASPVGTFTSTISYNTITMASDFTASNLYCIHSAGLLTPLPAATINITNNYLLNSTVAGSLNSFTGIFNEDAPGTLNISNNTIRGVNILGEGNFLGILNNGSVVNSININNNKIGDAVAGAVTYAVGSFSTVHGIFNAGDGFTATVSLNNNSFDGFSLVNVWTIDFILNGGNNAAVNINNNQLGTVTGSLVSFSGVQAFTLRGISITNTSGMSISIQNNDFRGITQPLTGTGAYEYIYCQPPSTLTNISNNTFTNLSLNTSNEVRLIYNNAPMASGSTAIISNNRIVGSFSNTAAGTNVTMYRSNSNAAPSGATLTISGNNFSNVTTTGATDFFGIQELKGPVGANSLTKTISGNTISNITMGSGNFYGLYIDRGQNPGVISNTISNVSTAGVINAVYLLPNSGAGTIDITSNTINTLNSTADDVYGIRSFSTSPAVTFNGNSLTGLSSGGSSKTVTGIYLAAGQTVNMYDNNINNLTGTGTGSAVVNGIWINNGTTVNIYRNKIHTLQQSGTLSAGSPAVNGMLFSNGTTVTAYNNFVANLGAGNADLADAVRGISVTSATAGSTYNLYYNSIYINATSTGTNFGTSGIYHLTNATATTGTLNMADNIIVNTSTANGTGLTAAYRRSDATLANFAAASDYNLWYAGIPSATRLIFYDGTNSDQTLAAYQARVSTREANSISMMPVFTSVTDLHLTPDNCMLDNKGTPVGGITGDIDADTRSVTVPDIGADEFDAYNTGVLAGVVSTAVCSNKAVVNTGTIYTDATCNLIAKVVPSGGSPVAGLINTCVTMDASQLYFNGDPYVQRHFDVEPATSNQTTTSATITMYFTDAEFELYNTNNSGAWPLLPTIGNGGNASPYLGNLRVTQFHGTPTGGLPTSTPGNYTGSRVALPPVSVVLTGSIWAVTVNVTGFSGFYVHSNFANTPLPIIVNYLTGRKQGSNHLLNWKVTCTSTPRAIMTLERSSDARNFSGLYTITADAARCQQPFDYTDANPLKGMNYYRLKMVDADGKITYSTTVALLNAVKGFDIVSLAPNPVVYNNFKLNVASAQAGKMEIVIFDMQGRVVNRQIVSVIAGFNSLPVHVDNLAAGTYTILGSIGEDRSPIIRFVKQ